MSKVDNAPCGGGIRDSSDVVCSDDGSGWWVVVGPCSLLPDKSDFLVVVQHKFMCQRLALETTLCAL